MDDYGKLQMYEARVNGLTRWKRHPRKVRAKKALRVGARSDNRSSDCVAGW